MSGNDFFVLYAHSECNISVTLHKEYGPERGAEGVVLENFPRSLISRLLMLHPHLIVRHQVHGLWRLIWIQFIYEIKNKILFSQAVVLGIVPE
jgi:hypothetical protein